MKRFLILSGILALLLLVAGVWPSRAETMVTVEFGAEFDDGGGRTARQNFFDHGYRPSEERRRNRWRDEDRPGVERVEEGYRFNYRDRGYEAVWLLIDSRAWDPVGMELDREAGTWFAVVALEPGTISYQFRVQREDGTVRDRTDPTNPTRRRDPEQGWTSRVEVGRNGELQIRERESSRDRSDFDLNLFAGFGADYQRVDGFFLRARPSFSSRDPWAPSVHTMVGYGFSSEESAGSLHFLQPLVRGGRARAVFSAYDFSDYTDNTGVGDKENSLATLVFREDSRDWYRRRGLGFGVEFEEMANLLVRVEFRSDEYESMPRRVIAGWGGRGDFMANPSVDEGIMRSLLLRARWGDDLTHLWVEYENGRSGPFSSSFDFESLIVQGRVRLQIGWAQALHLRARWGTELGGDLPIQKQFVAGGIGTVRGYQYQTLITPTAWPVPYGGDELALLNAEYVLGVHDDFAIGLFADSGMVWQDAGSLDLGDLKSSIGVGLILSQPHENALRLDLIQPLESGGSFMLQGRLTRPF